MVKTKVDSEELILDAARKVFTRKGMTGARMQEIADEAGINKALLHYYFRNKKQLFDAIFDDVFPRFIPALIQILNSDNSIEEKLSHFVSHYIDEFSHKAYIPVFILNEIHQNPERLASMSMAIEGMKTSRFMVQISEGIETGLYHPIKPAHLLSNLISLSVFPLISQPLLTRVFQMDDKEYMQFLEEKKKLIPELILESIKRN